MRPDQRKTLKSNITTWKKYGAEIFKKNGGLLKERVGLVLSIAGRGYSKQKKITGFILPPPLIRCGGVHRVRSELGYCDLFLRVECVGDHCGSIPVMMALEEKKL